MLALTLHRNDFREYDQVITFYTRERGKLEAVARGVKKSIARNSSALEEFCLLEAEFVPGRGLTYVTRAYVLESFAVIRERLEKILPASFALRLVATTVGLGEKDERLFSLLYSFLKFIAAVENPSPLLVEAFTLQLWKLLGFVPRLDGCVKCGSSLGQLYFDAAAGGLKCENCLQAASLPPVDEEVLMRLRGGLKNSWEELQAAKSSTADQKVHELVRDFSEYHTGRQLPNLQNMRFRLGLA